MANNNKPKAQIEHENLCTRDEKIERFPPKLHGMALVSFVEQDGKIYPVYREES